MNVTDFIVGEIYKITDEHGTVVVECKAVIDNIQTTRARFIILMSNCNQYDVGEGYNMFQRHCITDEIIKL